MSLISEALRKARRAEAEQEVRQRGRLYRSTIPLAHRRQHSGSKLLVAAALGIGVGLCVALSVWLVLDRNPPGPEPSPTSVEHVSAEESALSPGGVEPESLEEPRANDPDEAPPPQAESSRVPDTDATTPPDAPPEIASAVDERPFLDDQVDQRPLPEPPSPIRPAPLPEPAGGARVFVIDADLGHITLSLGFIVFRSIDPFAEINGIEVRKGSIIEGFTVEGVEVDRVLLRDPDGPLVLRVP